LYDIHGVKLLEMTMGRLVPAAADQILVRAVEVVSSNLRDSRQSVDGVDEDCGAFVQAVANDIAVGKLLPTFAGREASGRIGSRLVDRAVDESFRFLWMSIRHRKNLRATSQEGYRNLASACLLCVLFLSANFEQTARVRRRMAPNRAILELIGELGPNKYEKSSRALVEAMEG
jgi:hypothetical protein